MPAAVGRGLLGALSPSEVDTACHYAAMAVENVLTCAGAAGAGSAGAGSAGAGSLPTALCCPAVLSAPAHAGDRLRCPTRCAPPRPPPPPALSLTAATFAATTFAADPFAPASVPTASATIGRAFATHFVATSALALL